MKKYGNYNTIKNRKIRLYKISVHRFEKNRLLNK